MKKKGIVSGQMILWALGIAGVFFILYSFLGPGKALANTKDAAFSIGQDILPGEAVGNKEETKVPSELESYFDIMVSWIKYTQTGDGCLVDIGEIKIPESYVISLSDGRAEINRVKEEGKAEGEISVAPLKTENIAGFKPCIVQNLPAVYFHYCYLAEEMPNKEYTRDAYCKSPLFETPSRVILEKDGKYSRYLFKSGENYCVIEFYNDVDGWKIPSSPCDPPKDVGKYGIDNDCIGKLSLCGVTKQDAILYEPVFVGGTFYGKKDEWSAKDENGFNLDDYYYIGEDTRVAFMFTLRARVYTGPTRLTKEKLDEIFSSQSEAIPEKNGVYYEGAYYGPKEDWEFKEGGGFCGGMTQCWVYTGVDGEVPQEFREKGISPDKKLSLFGPMRIGQK